jgi:hypothetical protein
MNELQIRDFVNQLSVLKDVQTKSELIKSELKKLDKLISDLDVEDNLTRFERLNRKLQYSELFTLKSLLALKLSFLSTEGKIEN